MTQEEKDLLLKDICGRALYGVFVEYDYGDSVKRATKFHGNYLYLMMEGSLQWKDFKPYLRPMLSMTEEEKKEFESLGWRVDELDDNVPWNHNAYNVFEGVDWLNKKMFDYRGLIPMGLALEAPEDMYNLNQGI